MDHKIQFCRQIRDTLFLCLPVDLNVELIDVIPGNSPSHIIAIVSPTEEFMDKETFYRQLEVVRPEIIEEIAAVSNRRKLPDISFKIYKPFDFNQLNY